MTSIAEELIDGMNLPFVWEICDRCDGHGHHANPAFDGTTQEFWDEDPDFAEAYFAGRHDVRCDECNGSGKVKAPDIEKMSPEDFNDYKSSYIDILESHETSKQERMMEMGAAYFYG